MLLSNQNQKNEFNIILAQNEAYRKWGLAAELKNTNPKQVATPKAIRIKDSRLSDLLKPSRDGAKPDFN